MKKLKSALFAAALGLLFFSPEVFAQTVWTGTTGLWDDPANWSAGAPDENTDAQISNGGTAQMGLRSYTARNVIFGFGSSDSGNLSATNGFFEISGAITVGRAGVGDLNFGNSDLTSNGGVIGELAGSQGTVLLAFSTWDNSGDLIIGQSGTGSLDFEEGVGQSVNGVIGESTDGIGAVNLVHFSGWHVSDTLSVGQSATGTLNINDNSLVSDTTGFIGELTSSSAMVTVGLASGWTNRGNLYVGGNSNGAGGKGILRIQDFGRVTAITTVIWNTGTLELGPNPRMTGGLTFVGGALRTVADTTFSNDATLAAGGVIIDSNGFNSTLSGVLSGTGGLTKTHSGMTTLTNASTYTGPTTISGGKLIVNGSITSAVTVNGGALGGSGTTGAITVNNGGALSPGNSPGILHAVGNLTLAMGSTYLVDLNGAAVGAEYDQTDVTGLVNLDGGTLSLSLAFNPTAGMKFLIINNDLGDLVTGMFSGLPEGAVFSAGDRAFAISYQGGDGNDVELTSVVPEPETWGLLIAGAAALIMLHRRSQARA